MSSSPSLLTEIPGETIAEPIAAGGFFRGRVGRGLLLAGALLLAGGALGLPRLCGTSCCAARRAAQQRALVAQARPAESDEAATWRRLRERDQELTRELAAYEKDIAEGRGCHQGWIKLRLEQLHIRERFSHCGRQQAYLRAEIARLEALQSQHTLPAGHPDVSR